MYFWCFGFRGELGFLNCDDVCMCVVNKQFELLEFVSESVYVDLQCRLEPVLWVSVLSFVLFCCVFYAFALCEFWVESQS